MKQNSMSDKAATVEAGEVEVSCTYTYRNLRRSTLLATRFYRTLTELHIVILASQPQLHVPCLLYPLEVSPTTGVSIIISTITILTTSESLSTMAAKQPTSRTAANTTSHVRRNLFHHHLSRRPTSASTSTTATTLFESPQDNSSDIVMRDKNGNYEVENPSLPVMDDEALPEDPAREKKGARSHPLATSQKQSWFDFLQSWTRGSPSIGIRVGSLVNPQVSTEDGLRAPVARRANVYNAQSSWPTCELIYAVKLRPWKTTIGCSRLNRRNQARRP